MPSNTLAANTPCMMPRFLCSLLFCITITACNSSNEKEAAPMPESNMPPSSLPASLEPFADSLVRLDKYKKENLDHAAYYFTKLVPADSTLADSASVMLLAFAGSIADTVNQKIWKDAIDLSNLVYQGGPAPTNEQKLYEQELKKNHINLQGNGEGDALAVLDYNWLNAVVQPKTSAAVDGYFDLMALEEKDPTLQDAGLAIEMKRLIDRLIKSEELGQSKLPVKFANDVQQRMTFYTNVLLLGSDNSPSIDNETTLELTPEFRDGYQYLLTNYSSSDAAGKVKEWLAIVKAKDHKKVEQMRAAQYQ